MKNLREEMSPVIRAPLVTIVILNHNYAEFVERCIQSVDQQDYANIQCIVLDCASTDDSIPSIERALGKIKNTFFTFIRRDINCGHFLNYLSALDEIQGAFVTFLDADDLLFPTFVSTHVKAQLNGQKPAALSVTDQIQVDAGGQVLAGTCHWHQKWRASEAGAAWSDLTHARSWDDDSPYQMERLDLAGLYYVPAWWSSWVAERWIWSAMSGIMFRKSVIECLVPPQETSANLREISMDSYFSRFAHSVGGTLVIDSTQGGYCRHGRNKWSGNPVLGGQTPNGSGDPIKKFSNCQSVAKQVVVMGHATLSNLLGVELYYSVAWQLMSNEDFLDFARLHPDESATWEKTVRIAGAHDILNTQVVSEPSQHLVDPSNDPISAAFPMSLRRARVHLAALKSRLKRAVQRFTLARAEPSAEKLSVLLFDDLDDHQRGEVCFGWNFQDPERGLLRSFIANHWQVTRPVITGGFFTLKQQRLIRQIFESLLAPDWREAFVKQLADDTQGHAWGQDQSVAFFGDPHSSPWQFVITGRHMTLRTGSRQSQVFAGPIVYGHAATSYWEQANHPHNIFWPQAQAASRLYNTLDRSQRKVAEIEALPEETKIGFDTAASGISARQLSADQKEEFTAVLRCLVAPFRDFDRSHIMACLAHQGGIDALSIAFARAHRISAPDWDDWRIQGPSFVWHWRGWPHVHVWVNVGDDPKQPVNARSGTFIFSNHDPLQ